jgi:hypothetical protein
VADPGIATERLISEARALLTPGDHSVDEWVLARIRWHRLDGNDALADHMLEEENGIRRALDKEPLGG